ncbi:MAG: hypothetical protein PF487_13280 [Bacteroidales bacterium]|jgi:hypothetical protein|nr:hypothetical protein [Bacteroidales bacterium]
MFWGLLIGIVIIILIRFFNGLSKDNDDVRFQPLNEKFKVIAGLINEDAFNGFGKITSINNREFNIYQEGQNQIIQFQYSTGHLTIIWKYKYFQKEVVHKKQFNDVRNLSLFEQQRIAEIMINEMDVIINNHHNSVLGGY